MMPCATGFGIGTDSFVSRPSSCIDSNTLAGTAALCYVYPQWITFRANHAPLVWSFRHLYFDFTLTGLCQVTLSSGLGSAALVDMLVAITLSYYLKYGRQNWHRHVLNFVSVRHSPPITRKITQGLQQHDQSDLAVHHQHRCSHWVRFRLTYFCLHLFKTDLLHLERHHFFVSSSYVPHVTPRAAVAPLG